MQRGLRVITLQAAIKKSPILLSQYWKNECLDGTIIISYFGGSNNIFADCSSHRPTGPPFEKPIHKIFKTIDRWISEHFEFQIGCPISLWKPGTINKNPLQKLKFEEHP